MKKKILIYPAGTEIAFEIHRSIRYSTHFTVYAGTSDKNHSNFVYERLIENLPFISDDSTESEVKAFDRAISELGIDYIYPAMDGVISAFSRYRNSLKSVLITMSNKTVETTRRKSLTYEALKEVIKVPKIYKEPKEAKLPVFVKPDIGQGSVGARLIREQKELYNLPRADFLIMEYLSGKEYTVDCFTNLNGELIFARGRGRGRIKGGISVNTAPVGEAENKKFFDYAKKINSKLELIGAWFFQLREDKKGELTLLEVGVRIAGGSGIVRNMGINLPLLTIFTAMGNKIDSLIENKYEIEMDRALSNSYRLKLSYDTVYIDFDDTILIDNSVNVNMVSFLYSAINKGKKVILITKHSSDIDKTLTKYRLAGIFDEVIQLKRDDEKYRYIDTKQRPIFIDDSYIEREKVYKNCKIPVFDTCMLGAFYGEEL